MYRAQTKGKVERFNLYLKRNFYVPLKAALKGSDITITTDLLNGKLFSWLEMANARIHDTTKKQPIELFEQEKPLLEAFYSSVKEVKKDKKPIHANINIAELDIDIIYHTTISDYEKVLGATYASA